MCERNVSVQTDYILMIYNSIDYKREDRNEEKD